MHLLAEAGSGLSPGPSGGLEGQEGGEQGWQPPGAGPKRVTSATRSYLTPTSQQSPLGRTHRVVMSGARVTMVVAAPGGHGGDGRSLASSAHTHVMS